MKTFVKPLTVVAFATLFSVGSTKLDLSSITGSPINKSNTASMKMNLSPAGVDEPTILKKESKKTQYAAINKSVSSSITKINTQSEKLLDKIRFIASESNDILLEPVSEAADVESLIKFVLPTEDNNNLIEPVEVNYVAELIKFKTPVVSNDEIIEPKSANEVKELVKFKVPVQDETEIAEPTQLDKLIKFKVQLSDDTRIEEPTTCDNQLTRASK